MRLLELFGNALPARQTFFSENDLFVVLRARELHVEFDVFEMLLIYESPKQRTWIVATGDYAYCVFDIKTEISPRVKWKQPYSDPTKVSIDVRDLTVRDGTVAIGGKKPRKFSKLLFQFQPISIALILLFERAKKKRVSPKKMSHAD